MSRQSRLQFAILSLMVVFSLLVACAPTPAPAAPTAAPSKATEATKAPTVAPTSPPAAQVKKGGKLVVGTTADLIDFNAFNSGFSNYPLMHQVWDRLIIYDHVLNIKPLLGESWTVNKEGTELTFKLRQGVKFHNGREFVADDVVKNIELAKQPAIGNFQAKIQNLDRAEATDKYTVVFKFKSATPNMFDILNEFSVMAPESFANVSKGPPIGTGPFKFKEWVPGDHLTLVRNEDYWMKGLPYLDELTFKPYADTEALVTALQTGIIDAAIAVPPRDVERLKKAGVQIRAGQTAGLMYSLTVNPPDSDQPKGPLSNKAVRQAINFALDRKAIIDQALFGLGEATQLPFPSFSLAYFADLKDTYPFKLETAKAKLAEGGYPNGGFKLKTITHSGFPEMIDMAQILKSDMAKLGVDLDIQPLDAATYTAVRFGKETNGSGDFDLDFTFIGRSHLDPLGLFDNSPYRPFNSPVFPRGDFPAGYAEALKEAGAIVDKDQRKALFRKVQEIMLEECVDIPVAWKYTWFAYQTSVKDFDYSVGDEILLTTTWVDKK